MKVLYIINNLTKGGAERFVLDLISFLNENTEVDYRLAVLDEVNQYEEYSDEVLKMTNINYVPFSFRKQNKNQKLAQLLEDFNPDIIHSNLFLAEFVTAHYVQKQIKYVCHGHDNMHQFKPLSFRELFDKKKIINRVDYFVLNYKKYKKVPTYFIANSKHTFDYYFKNVPKQQRKNVHLIQCGFDFEKFYQEKNRFLTNKKLQLVNVGSYQPKKNQTFAVDIANELKNRGVDFEFNLIGHGSEYKNVGEKIKALGLEDHVFQRGLQSNVEDWYKNSDIYLHTANYEPFGLVFLEAMAAGLPIITLDGKGNRDIIENDKNGYLLEQENVKLFADKIIEYSQNQEKYKELSTYAQAYAKTFDMRIKTKELIDFYTSILD